MVLTGSDVKTAFLLLIGLFYGGVLRAKFTLYIFLPINLKAFGCELNMFFYHTSVIEDSGRPDQ